MPITLDVTADSPPQSFNFTAAAGSEWSLTAQTIAGDVDPVLLLFDATTDERLAANDDERVGSPNARIEGWVAPNDGQYRVQVGRAGGALLPSVGTLQVTLIPGESRLFSSLPPTDATTLGPGEAVTLATLPADVSTLVLRLEVGSLGEDALRIRGVPEGEGGWQITLRSDGWTVRLTEDADPIRTRVPLDAGELTLTLSEDALTLSQSDVPLASLDITDAPLFYESALSLIAQADDANTDPVRLQQVIAAAPFYTAGIQGVPPAMTGERIYNAANGFAAIMEEFVAQGILQADPNAPSGLVGQGLVLRIDAGSLETADRGVSTFPLDMAASGYQDFVLGFEARLVVGSPSAACGVTFRQQGSADFGMALISADGNAYVLDYLGGALMEGSQAIASPFAVQGTRVINRGLLLVQGDDATFYLNGRRVIQTTLEDRPGVVNFAIVLQDTAYTLCQLQNVWLWSLD